MNPSIPIGLISKNHYLKILNLYIYSRITPSLTQKIIMKRILILFVFFRICTNSVLAQKKEKLSPVELMFEY